MMLGHHSEVSAVSGLWRNFAAALVAVCIAGTFAVGTTPAFASEADTGTTSGEIVTNGTGNSPNGESATDVGTDGADGVGDVTQNGSSGTENGTDTGANDSGANAGDGSDANQEASGDGQTLKQCTGGAWSGEYIDTTGCARPVTDVDDGVFADHVVTDDVIDPSGTTTNLFDYWWDQENASDAEYKNDYYKTGGINKDRQLKFRREQHNEPKLNINTVDQTGLWEDNVSGPLQGMVKPTLENDFPSLQESEKLGITKDEPLSYLFNTAGTEGKRVHANVSGLFQLKDGYYTYDSQKNFASYDANSNHIRLYDSPGTNTSWNTARGQFFPFNAPGDVFRTTTDSDGNTTPVVDGNGHLTMNDVKSVDPSMNHYLGMSMSTRFVQKNGGHTIDGTNKPITYEFSGDDDVWVYIDGVLVGDLGGIHDRSSLKIDFSTGKVEVGYTPAKGESKVLKETTIRKMFKAAGQEKSVTWADSATSTASDTADSGTTGSGDTFADDTYHTLQLFYLERGGLDSNLSLRFNLVTMPESDIVKVDQDGKAIEGVGFDLYASDKDYTVGDKPTVVARGVTDVEGNLDLRNPTTDEVVFMDTIAQKYKTNHFVLRETPAPEGYRKVRDLHLKYERHKTDAHVGTALDTGVLVVDSGPSNADSPVWDTGALAMAKVQVRAPTESALMNAVTKENAGITEDALRGGTLFAVVFQKTGANEWKGVYGDQITGWKHTEHFESTGSETREAAIEAFQANPYVFKLSSSGSYETLLENLPGDIRDYHYWDGEAGALYSVGYYFSTSGDAKDVSTKNTIRLDDANFTRLFGVKLYVPNILNTVSVQKVDEDGKALGDAEFTLYKKTDDTCDASSTETVRATCGTAVDTLTTADHHTAKATTPAGATIPKFKGVGTFPNTAGVRLTNGTYYIVETKSPDASKYELNTTPTEVVVTDHGVFANAGKQDDGVKVVRGVGTLVDTMAPYGAAGSVDGTLTWVKMKPELYSSVTDSSATMDVAENGVQSAKVTDGEVVPDTTMADSIRLKYGSTAATVLEYEPREENGSLVYVSDVGYLMPETTQDAAPKDEAGIGRVDLGEKRLSDLITGSAIVQVTDKSTDTPPTPPTPEEPSTDITIPGVKKLEGRDLKAGEFRFAIAAKTPGAPLPANTTVSNDANGGFSFGPIRFTKEGVYEYTITEVKGSLEHVTYDGATYTVKVTVTKNGDTLAATYEVLDADGNSVDKPLTFTNAYEPPTTPPEPEEPDNPDEPDEPNNPDEPTTPEQPDEPGTPTTPSEPSKPTDGTSTLVKTGSQIAPFAIAAVALAIVGLTVLVIRRRRTGAR